MTPYRQELHLTVRDFISVNHYLAYHTVMKNGRPMAVSYKTKEAKDFQKKFIVYTRQQAREQGWITDLNPFQHYYVDAVFYFPRVDMDCNNYWKVSFDAITDSGVVWVDDNMACERVQWVFYDPVNPRIEYTIYKTDFIGVLRNQDEYDRFMSKCKNCIRYDKNCVLLKKALEGRIQKEINGCECSRYKEAKERTASRTPDQGRGLRSCLMP